MSGYDAADGIADKTARQRLTDTELNRIAGGAYCFVEPDGAGFDMRDMAIELIGRRATIAALPIAPPASLQATGYDAATVELLPCQVCGGRGEVRTSRDGEATFVRCVVCGFSGPVVITDNQPEAEAIAAWNLRALPLAPPAPLQVTADDVALIELTAADLDNLEVAARSTWDAGCLAALIRCAPALVALARRAAPAVHETVLDRLRDMLALVDEIDIYQKRPERGEWGVECACCMGELLDDERERIAAARAALNREGNG